MTIKNGLNNDRGHELMGVASYQYGFVVRIIGVLAVLSLPACSMGGIGGFSAQPSLAYQNPDVGSSLSKGRVNRSSAVAKSTSKSSPSVAKRSAKNKAVKPQLDALEARDIINTYRIAKGLKPLYVHPKLTQAAQQHAKDLAQRDEISHYGKDGSTPWTRVEKTGYRPRVAAENVGTGQVSIGEVFKGWKESASHNENLLLSDATHMGIALVHKPKSKLKTFWTLVLGSPQGEGIAPVASSSSLRTGG